MTRSSASLFLPFVILIAVAAVIFLKPWQHLGVGGPALPTLSPAVTAAQPVPADHSRTTKHPGRTKLSAGELEVVLTNETYSATSSFAPGRLQWSCKSDPSGQWDYTCTLRQNDSVWGYDVDNSQITSRSELSWEGHTLTP